jgi:hypothetical protein
MMTPYIVLANCVAILHAMVACYMLSIVFCVYKKNLPSWYLQIQTAIIGISVVTNLATGVCPLTYFENKFRTLGGGEAYKGNFLNHYSTKFFNVPLSNELIFRSILVFFLLLIFMLVTRWAKFRKRALV